MRITNLLFAASWIILLVLSVAVVLYSALSLWRGYTAWPDSLTSGYTLKQIEEQGGTEAATAFRSRRITASTAALGYGLLAIAVTIFPYRRAERWAWWALFVSLGLSQFLSLARAIALGTTAGLGMPAIILSFALLGLMAGAPKLFARKS